ncbi:CHAT domain-containing protein [Flavivirga amylovorans]|uniref:CHAT domain-containing protein n=1 Tax=Flavivirga amylovorans TaxID=870486 RepID=A0ABT8X2U2_9FLAO|nr:CHAT domain-containing protein [Flavivirga amylovorans]MDO5988277.1 CHAT domain-containing protein [Flavivirga amylovorans]
MKKLSLIFFLIYGIAISQNLEENIYVAAETFISNPNNATLNLLSEQESTFKKQVKSKSEQLALVFLQCHKGFYLEKIFQLKDAITTFEDASNRFKTNNLSKFSHFDIIESCLIPLGNLYTKTDDYTNAENVIKQYIYLAEKSNHKKHQISGIINLAILYKTIGKYKEVLSLTSNYLKKQNISKYQKQKIIELNIDSQIALKMINSVSDIPKRINHNAYNLYRSNYLIQLQNGNYTEALKAFNKAKTNIVIGDLPRRKLAKLYFEEAQLNKLLNNLNQAKNNLNSALETLLPNTESIEFLDKNNLYAENTFIDIFDLYATLQKDYKSALNYYNLSFYVSKLLENNWTSQENKISNQAANRIRSETCIDITFNEYLNTKNDTLLFSAFKYAELNKSGVLKEKSIKKALLNKYPNDSLLLKEAALFKKQEEITFLLINEQLGKSQASVISSLSNQLNTISIKLKGLKKTINKKYSELGDTDFLIGDLQNKLLTDEAVLIEYFYGKKDIYQFIISSKSISLNKINLDTTTKKQITDFIHLFDSASIINNDISKFTTSAFTLYNILNLTKTEAFKNVIIIPDGLLNFVPFEALLISKTNTTNFSKMPFVVKKQTVVYNTSAAFYLKKARKNKKNNLLGLFPVFEKTKNNLTYSIDEADAIKKEIPSTIFLRNQATKKTFIKKSSDYSIIHLSTHASSGDFSTSANIKFYEDTMFLNELYSLNLNATLVVLSACETGVGKLYKGEGAMSIARGFQYAGAQNVLFSLWQINDLSTSQIIRSFYKNYSSNRSAYISNHQSKLDYLKDETISNIKKSPYYWSAFVYYGELKEPSSSNSHLIYIVISLFIILIILLLLLRIKKSYGKNTARVSS